MADRNLKPPVPLVEGKQYEWNDTFGLYIGQTNDGEVVSWNPLREEWEKLSQSVEYEDYVSRHGNVPPEPDNSGKQKPPSGQPGSYVQGQPDWWDASKDGKYQWDAERYGDYPFTLEEDPDTKQLKPNTERADHKAASAIKKQIDTLYPKQEKQQGQLYPTYDEAVKNTPPGHTPVQLSNGMWGFTAVPQQSLNDRIDQLVLSGSPADLDKAWALDNIRDQLNAPRGLTPDQAANLVMGLAVAPDEARSWIDMLTADWHAQRGLPPPTIAAPGSTPATAQETIVPGTPFGPPVASTTESNNQAALAAMVNPNNRPPVGWGGPRFLSKAQTDAMTPEELSAYWNPGGAGYVGDGTDIYPGESWQSFINRTGKKDPFATTSPTTSAPTTTTPFASPQSTPIQVRQPFSTGPSSALWKSGNQAQYEQQLFGSKPLGLQDTFQQMWQRQWNQQQQRRFQAQRPQRTTYA